MKKTLLYTLLITAGTSLALVSSCRKADDNEIKETANSAEDCTYAETAMMSAFDVMDDVGSTEGRMQKAGSTVLPSGAIVQFTDSLFSDGNGVALYIDFGTSPLLCKDGKYRSGIVRITASAPYSQTGSTLTATFSSADQYKVGVPADMILLKGILTVTNLGHDSSKVEIANGETESNRGKTTFYSSKVITRTAGGNQPGIYGDVYEITGNGGGTNRNGENYETSIVKTLVKKVEIGCATTCVAGIIQLKNIKTGSTFKVDFDPYNNAACDKLVRITFPKGTQKDLLVW